MDSQKVEISHEVADDLLRVRIAGPAELPMITAYVVLHQADWIAHSRILWDLRELNPARITSGDILNIDQAFSDVIALRSGGRSAFLVSKDIETIARIAVALSHSLNATIEFQTFLDESEALDWLVSG